jgi:DNA-binding CsgD family transcriptional regulator
VSGPRTGVRPATAVPLPVPIGLTAPTAGSTAVAAVDPSLRICAVDDELCARFGRERAQLCGKRLADLLRPSAPGELERQAGALAHGGQHRFTERVTGYGRGEPFRAELTGTAVRDRRGGLAAVIVLLRFDESDGEDAAAELPAGVPVLTELDGRILEGVAAGASTMQLAAKLYLSRQGVEYHVGTMLRRLRVANRAALVSRAYALGLLEPGAWPPRLRPTAID